MEIYDIFLHTTWHSMVESANYQEKGGMRESKRGTKSRRWMSDLNRRSRNSVMGSSRLLNGWQKFSQDGINSPDPFAFAVLRKWGAH